MGPVDAVPFLRLLPQTLGGSAMRRNAISFTVTLVPLVAVILFLFGCSGKSSSSMSSSVPATVNMTVSDPATCSGPQGPFSHIYVTITDVQINASSSAGDNDPGWIDLTPKLQQNPQQVDLLGQLGQANDQCFLAMLGSTTDLQPGSYQQIRIVLASNSTAVQGNRCGGNANCVVVSSNPNAPQPLLLS